MKNYFKIHKKDNKGFAILFTLLILSIIIAIASGLSLNLLKNLTLSSTARESQVAFYQSDTAGECGLFASRYVDLENLASVGDTFSCGGLVLDVYSPYLNKYILSDSGADIEPCFNLDIDKTTSPIVIKARGYNMCAGDKVVERGIEISY